MGFRFPFGSVIKQQQVGAAAGAGRAGRGAQAGRCSAAEATLGKLRRRRRLPNTPRVAHRLPCHPAVQRTAQKRNGHNSFVPILPRTPQDIFDPAVALLEPDAEGTSLASDSPNRTIAPGEELLFSFLGTKGAGGRQRRFFLWAGVCPVLIAGGRLASSAFQCVRLLLPPRAGELNATNPYGVGAIEDVSAADCPLPAAA